MVCGILASVKTKAEMREQIYGLILCQQSVNVHTMWVMDLK